MPTTAEVCTVTVGGQRLRVAITSGPNGPGREHRIPLLLINGIGASLEALEPFVTALDGAIEVIRFDPPGVGGSPLPPGPYRFSGLCRLIAGMLTELGRDQADVLGISWGGAVAQHFAGSSGTGAAGWCWSRPRRARR
jgi:poly(3-hydroxyoctanoate) depolymerase